MFNLTNNQEMCPPDKNFQRFQQCFQHFEYCITKMNKLQFSALIEGRLIIL